MVSQAGDWGREQFGKWDQNVPSPCGGKNLAGLKI